MGTGRYFHVSSCLNRDSIEEHGLDWRLMGRSRGIAGSSAPEQDGCFVCLDDSEVEWFLGINNTGGPVDVWAVDGVDERELRESPEGHFFLPRTVPAQLVVLVRRAIAPR